MKTMSILLAVLGFLAFAGFLGIIIFKVPQTVLIIVFVATMLMVVYDFVRDFRNGDGH